MSYKYGRIMRFFGHRLVSNLLGLKDINESQMGSYLNRGYCNREEYILNKKYG